MKCIVNPTTKQFGKIENDEELPEGFHYIPRSKFKRLQKLAQKAPRVKSHFN